MCRDAAVKASAARAVRAASRCDVVSRLGTESGQIVESIRSDYGGFRMSCHSVQDRFEDDSSAAANLLGTRWSVSEGDALDEAGQVGGDAFWLFPQHQVTDALIHKEPGSRDRRRKGLLARLGQQYIAVAPEDQRGG